MRQWVRSGGQNGTENQQGRQTHSPHHWHQINLEVYSLALQGAAKACVVRGLILCLLYLQKAVSKTTLLDRDSPEMGKLIGMPLFTFLFHSFLKQRWRQLSTSFLLTNLSYFDILKQLRVVLKMKWNHHHQRPETYLSSAVTVPINATAYSTHKCYSRLQVTLDGALP